MNQLSKRLTKALLRQNLKISSLFLQKRMISIAVSKRSFSTAFRGKYTFDEEQSKLQIQTPPSNESHKSNAQELINKIPVIEVDQNTIRCRGVNELALGHPVVYIQVMGKFPHIPAKCKWCGLRYIKRGYLQTQQMEENN